MDLTSLPLFRWPVLDGAHILIVGIGGGSDIISAFAIGQTLSTDAELIYANTKTNAEPDWMHLSSHIARLPPKKAVSERLASGGTSIDRLLPKGARDCPWIFMLKKGEEDALLQEIQAQQFSHVIAVDTGGDVLSTKGAVFQVDRQKALGQMASASFPSPGGQRYTLPIKGKIGRDQRMYALLQRLGLPLWLVVIAPGADGQSTRARMEDDLTTALATRAFLGAMSLDDLLPTMQRFAPSLPAVRTPSLICAAYESTSETMLIPRGCKPTLPVAWLKMALVFGS